MVGFSIDEIFEMAEQIERNGARFYRLVSDKVTDDEVKKNLLRFAVMEEEHEKMFRTMREENAKAYGKASVFDPDELGVQYLQAFVDGRIFDVDAEKISEVVKQLKTVDDIFNMAIDSEKDSIVFYVGVKSVVESDSGKLSIDKIISEEMGHIVLLDKMRESFLNRKRGK